MKVDTKELDDWWCAPKNHPITCLNPAPWRIHEARIESCGKVFVRGEESMWFRLDQCILDDYDALREFVENR